MFESRCLNHKWYSTVVLYQKSTNLSRIKANVRLDFYGYWSILIFCAFVETKKLHSEDSGLIREWEGVRLKRLVRTRIFTSSESQRCTQKHTETTLTMVAIHSMFFMIDGEKQALLWACGGIQRSLLIYQYTGWRNINDSVPDESCLQIWHYTIELRINLREPTGISREEPLGICFSSVLLQIWGKYAAVILDKDGPERLGCKKSCWLRSNGFRLLLSLLVLLHCTRKPSAMKSNDDPKWHLDAVDGAGLSDLQIKVHQSPSVSVLQWFSDYNSNTSKMMVEDKVIEDRCWFWRWRYQATIFQGKDRCERAAMGLSFVNRDQCTQYVHPGMQLQRRRKLWSNGSTSLDIRWLSTARQSLDYHAHQKQIIMELLSIFSLGMNMEQWSAMWMRFQGNDTSFLVGRKLTDVIYEHYLDYLGLITIVFVEKVIRWICFIATSVTCNSTLWIWRTSGFAPIFQSHTLPFHMRHEFPRVCRIEKFWDKATHELLAKAGKRGSSNP